MAKIVDKEQKKRAIALACKGLILQKGLHNLTVAQMAQAANIGKGTVYEYFTSKEEILFELALFLMQEHQNGLKAALQTLQTTREKVKLFASFFYDTQQEDLREIYKQFIALSLLQGDEEMMAFNAKTMAQYQAWFHSILEEGVACGEVDKNILVLAEGIFSVGDGLFIQSSITNSLEDLEEKLHRYIDTIFDMMECGV